MEQNLLKIGFDKAEAAFFSRTYYMLDDEDKKFLDTLGTEFSSGKGVETAVETQERLKPLADKYNADSKAIDLLFFLSNIEKMKEKYLNKGTSEEIFYDTLKDFKYKLDECKKYNGVLGIRTFRWYYYFMNAQMYALGRLQFHERKFIPDTYYKWNDITITPEDTVINMHIPSSGPLTREMRMDSYKKAFEFFGKTKGEYIVFMCSSWLIYEGYREVYKPGSNMADFMDDFDIIKNADAQENTFPNSVLVFGVPYEGDTSKFPADTTLQKNFIRHLNEGKRCGSGHGIIIFDGEKIVNNKRDSAIKLEKKVLN